MSLPFRSRDSIFGAGGTMRAVDSFPSTSTYFRAYIWFVKTLTLALAGLIAGCAAPQQPRTEDPEADRAMARRIDEICALPEAEREAEIERLKKESGLVLHCGGQKD